MKTMETGTGEPTVKPKTNERHVLPNALLIEPLYINGTYTLNLKKDVNPHFYGLAQEVISSIKTANPSTAEIIDAINKYVPPVEKDMGTYRANVKASREFPAVPIDTFFDPNNPSAYCQERSLFTQLILANYGIESKLTNVRGISKSDTPHLNH